MHLIIAVCEAASVSLSRVSFVFFLLAFYSLPVTANSGCVPFFARLTNDQRSVFIYNYFNSSDFGKLCNVKSGVHSGKVCGFSDPAMKDFGESYLNPTQIKTG